MAPSHSRQLLIWTLPTIAVFLSYLWYKRKRIGSKTDPSSNPKGKTISSATIKFAEDETHLETIKNSSNSAVPPSDSINISGNSSSPESSSQSSPKKFSRSLSGVDSAPIDIIIPPKLKATKSNPVVISDEDLDLEIEKIRSMRYYPTTIDLRKSPEKSIASNNNNNSSSNSGSGSGGKAKSISPPKESFTPTPTKVATSVIINSPMKKKMAQSVEEKLSPAKTSPLKDSPQTDKTKASNTPSSNNTSGREERRNSERDSANHSPADVMLASPSLSSISDNHSEGSNDSGKGGSDVATPPPSRTPGAEEPAVEGVSLYEFTVPQTLVGKLIGKRGSFVTLIKDKTGAHVIVRKHPRNNKMKLCAVEGTQQEIDSALKLIRSKFPLKRFPEITLEQVVFYSEMQMPAFQLTPEQLYLKLIEGINNDTIVSCMVAPNHLFLQQQNHPTFPNLDPLTKAMNVCYMAVDSPLLPAPIPDNTICAAYSVNSWYRAMVLSTDNESGTCYVKFLDYGGYAYVEQSNLRQIRGDFMMMPFQAAESYLHNIKPIGDEGWREEAYTAVAELTKGTIIYTQIADYAEDGIPLVHCYLLVGPRKIVFLNQELVNRGYAEWITSNDGEAAGVSVA